MLALISVLFAVAALFGWCSARVLKLPNTIGTMLLSAISSIVLLLLARVWPAPHDWAVGLLHHISFERLILHGMLSLLLFAGGFLLDLDGLRQHRFTVGMLAIFATLLSIAGVSGATFYTARVFGYHPALLECMIFGALISPTDPIAVIEMLRRVHAPRSLESELAGESLFNDGIGAVIFIALVQAAQGGHALSLPKVMGSMLLTSGGGILLGIALAIPVAYLMRTVQSEPIDLLLSLGLALGGYALADHLGISAPLEAVTAALVLRIFIEGVPLERVAHKDLHHFWTNLDHIQNAILFVLLGCGFLVVSFQRQSVLFGLSEIVLVNVARAVAVGLVLLVLRWLRPQQTNSLTLLTWGGLRGGLCIALALSVPPNVGQGWILTATYVIVVFSVLVQGTTIRYWLNRSRRKAASEVAVSA